MRCIAGALFVTLLPYPANAQKSTVPQQWPPVELRQAAAPRRPAPVPPAQVAQEVRAYRMDNEGRIVRELVELLAIPNVASDTENIQKNAAKLREMLEARGIETHLLPIQGRGPVIFGKLTQRDATRTVVFYAHYDGQPVDPAAWTDGKPFEPTLRTNSIEAGGKRIPFPALKPGEQPEYADDWRIYARSASDDKSPIVMLLAAIDALRTKKIPIAVNMKVILDGEEEAGSPNLERVVELNKTLFTGDALITCDGPVHQSGKPLVFFGNRGVEDVNITVYGPIRALHSGHYGNWAPNPAFWLARLLTSMKDETGRVLIDGFYDDVKPMSDSEKKAVEEIPANDAELMQELEFAHPEGTGKKLAELINLPSLNIRGLRSAYVGEQSQNVVPEKAEASLDLRLVKNIDPQKQFERLVAHIRKQGFYVVDREPTREERLKHAHIAKATYGGGYPAVRTSMDLPVSRKVVEIVEGAAGETVKVPTLGGSAPMYIFERLGLPTIGVPIVNYDNHQHSSDENVRLGHLWRGVEIYAALLADLSW